MTPEQQRKNAEALSTFRRQSTQAVRGFQQAQTPAVSANQVGTQLSLNQRRQQAPGALQTFREGSVQARREYQSAGVQARRQSRAAQAAYARQAPAARNDFRQASGQALRRFQGQQPAALRAFQTASTQARTAAAQQRPALIQANRQALAQARQQQPAAIAEYRAQMSRAGVNSRGLMVRPKSASEARRAQNLTTEMSRRATGGALSRTPVGGTTNVGFSGRLRDGGTVRAWSPFRRDDSPRKTIGGRSPTRRALGGASLINPNRDRTDRRARTDNSLLGKSATLIDPDRDRKGLRDARKYGRDAQGKARSRGEWEEREKLKSRARAILKKGPPTSAETAELESIKSQLDSADNAETPTTTAALAETPPPAAPVASDTDRYRGDAGFAIGAAAVTARGSMDGTIRGSSEELSSRLNGQATNGDDAQVKDLVGGAVQAQTDATDAARQQQQAASYRAAPARGRAAIPRQPLTRFHTRTPRAAEDALSRLESTPRYAAA